MNTACAILEFTDTSSHETTVRLTAWKAFNIIFKQNSELVTLLKDGNNFSHTLSTHLLQGITDDNWEIKVEVMESLILIYQSLVTKTSSITACCNGQDNNAHNSKYHLLASVSFFQVLKEAVTDYHAEVRKKGEQLVGLLDSTPYYSNCHQCREHILEVMALCNVNCFIEQERSPQEIFLDILQEILMAAKCEESELRETDCY